MEVITTKMLQQYAGLNAADRIGGFIFKVYLEDTSPSTAPGAETLTTTSFTSTVNGFSITATLPVELVSFDAETKEDHVFLNWKTASELNNDFFEIEKSLNGIDFESIGKISGSVESLEEKLYQFLDRNVKEGINYYRLKQVDFDGKYEYSKIISTERSTFSGITLHPTIAQSEINISVEEETGQINFKIIDLAGQVVQQGFFDSDEYSKVINISQLQSGGYFIQINQSTQIKVLKFFKTN